MYMQKLLRARSFSLVLCVHPVSVSFYLCLFLSLSLSISVSFSVSPHQRCLSLTLLPHGMPTDALILYAMHAYDDAAPGTRQDDFADDFIEIFIICINSSIFFLPLIMKAFELVRNLPLFLLF